MTTQELKLAVSKAVKIGNDQRVARQMACAECEHTKHVSQVRLAIALVDRIPELAGVAAQLGQERVTVMVFGGEDYDRPYSHRNQWETCLPSWLKGVARIVFDDCEAAGLAPKIQYWYDAEGPVSGYNIVIRLK